MKKNDGSKKLVSCEQLNQSDSTSEIFEDMLRSFSVLSEVEDPVKHEFDLIKIARSLKVPISSYRKMYRYWKLQQEEQI